MKKCVYNKNSLDNLAVFKFELSIREGGRVSPRAICCHYFITSQKDERVLRRRIYKF